MFLQTRCIKQIVIDQFLCWLHHVGYVVGRFKATLLDVMHVHKWWSLLMISLLINCSPCSIGKRLCRWLFILFTLKVKYLTERRRLYLKWMHFTLWVAILLYLGCLHRSLQSMRKFAFFDSCIHFRLLCGHLDLSLILGFGLYLMITWALQGFGFLCFCVWRFYLFYRSDLFIFDWLLKPSFSVWYIRFWIRLSRIVIHNFSIFFLRLHNWW